MSQTYPLSIFYRSFFLALLCLLFVGLMSGCKDDDNDSPDPDPYTITVSDVIGIPDHVVFDRVKVEISGTCWEIIGSVEATYEHGDAVLTIPSVFLSEKLQKVDRSGNDMCGHWDVTASDPNALVARLGDFFAYNGDKRVGRIYLTDWTGEGSNSEKAFIYYHYTDRPFTLSGYNNQSSYVYSTSFKKGWNAYANINPVEQFDSNGNVIRGAILCTTSFSDRTALRWRFESYMY